MLGWTLLQSLIYFQKIKGTRICCIYINKIFKFNVRFITSLLMTNFLVVRKKSVSI